MGSNANRNKEISYKIDKMVDARNLTCPGPILMLSSSLADMPKGSVIMVIARDPAFEEDLKSWSTYTGNEILDLRRAEGEIIAVVRKSR
ncbi:MAG: sulfurtransferase TusA family protein [Desulfurococcales archaeon]|nr:sulfurtransferase TusA family protein [Desulfurococcales archaeon]